MSEVEDYAADVDPAEDAEAEAVAEIRAGEEEAPGTGTPVNDPDACPHPAGDRLRDEDGTQVCAACGAVVEQPTAEQQAGGSGWIEPAEPESGVGVLRHIPWGPGQRPYTPEDVEHEILDYIARLNSGARFQAAKEQELREAEIAYEINYARKLIDAPGRSEKMRTAWALLQVEEEWTKVTVLRQVVRTTREGMHTLRQQLTGLQSVARSVGAVAGHPSGRAFQ